MTGCIFNTMEPNVEDEQQVIVLMGDELVALQSGVHLPSGWVLEGAVDGTAAVDGCGVQLATDGTVQFLQDIAMETLTSTTDAGEDPLPSKAEERPSPAGSPCSLKAQHLAGSVPAGQGEREAIEPRAAQAEGPGHEEEQEEGDADSRTTDRSPSRSPTGLLNYIQPSRDDAPGAEAPRRKRSKAKKGKVTQSRSRKRGGADDERVVISIHRRNVLSRVVLAAGAPYVCGYCATAFTHADPLREHVEVDHDHQEPAEVTNGGIGHQIVMKRTFRDKPKLKKKSLSRLSKSSGNKTMAIRAESSPTGVLPKSPLPEPVPSGSWPSSPSDDDIADGSDGSDGSDSDESSTSGVSGADGYDGDAVDLSSCSSSEGSEPEGDVAFQIDKEKSGAVVTNKRVVMGNRNQSGVNGTSRLTNRDPGDGQQNGGTNSSLSHSGNTVQSSVDETNQTDEAVSLSALPKDTKSKEKGNTYRKNSFKCIYCCHCSTKFSERLDHYAEVHGQFKDQGQARKFQKKKAAEAGVESGSVEANTLFECSMCHVYFNEESAAKKHMLVRHCGEGRVKCQMCSEAIRLWKDGNAEELGRLMKKYEGELEEKSQDELGMDSGAADSEDANVVTDQLAGKEKAQDILRRSLERTNAMSSSNVTVLSCPKCSDEFFLAQHLQNHYKWHGPLECNECDKKIDTMTSYVIHHAREHKIFFFKCRFCLKEFEDQGKLNYHMLGHLGFFQCIVCGITLMSKQSLENHISAVLDSPMHVEVPGKEHKRFSAREPYQQHQSFAKGRRDWKHPSSQHECCGRTFNRKGAYMMHMKSAHPAEYFDLHTVSSLHCCDQCGALLSSKTALKLHMKRHLGRTIPCPVEGCQMKFNRKMYLTMHLKAHNYPSAEVRERTLGNLQCGLCYKTFKNEATLNNHLSRHEGSLLKYSCKFCPKMFRNVTHLRYHEKRHTGERDHVCQHCGKGYADPSVLKTHLLTHSTERPFQCQHCDRAFPTVLYLRAHTRSHTKPFKCSPCGEGFSTKGARRKHLQREHGIVEPAGKLTLYERRAEFGLM